jgi:2-methylcitrate dehydratase PrpD
MTSVAERLAESIAAVRVERLPAKLREVAQDLVLDVVGLCLAARGTDYVRAALAAVTGSGRSTAIGHAGVLDCGQAAIVNGMAAHGEDFDDTFEGGPIHAGAAIVPAVLAAAEEFGSHGDAVLRGIAVGVETACRLSLVAPKRVHQAGFHPTSVLGTMGAAAAVGAMLGLDRRQLVDALGIAGSMAGGIIEYLADGSWTKRLHPGWAAQAGVRAALLARHGFVGPSTVFEGTHGLFHGFARGAEGDFGKLLDDFGVEWVTETIAFKPFACGTMTHPYIDCAIRLARRGIAVDEIEDIVCEVGEGTVHRLWEPLAQKQSPPNAYAAKFSTPFCIAAGYVLGDAGLSAFTEETVRDPRIRTLMAKVGYVVDPDNPYPREFTGHIRARLRNGEVIEERQPHLRGGAHEPLSRDAIEAKFFANAAFGGWSRAAAGRARECVRRLFSDRIDLQALRG